MEQSKTGKYFKYAIGEIVLVVIGILIALQINNWNENRKYKIQEIKILKDFKNNIHNDLIELEKTANRYNESANSKNFLINYLEQDLPYHDSLSLHFGNINVAFRLIINTSVFENLKSKGFDLISNDSLKEEILKFYSYAENNLLQTSQRYTAIIDDASKTIYNKRFDAIYEPNSREFYSKGTAILGGDYKVVMKPLDYESLKNDKEFMYYLKSLRNQQYWLITTNINRIEKDLNTILNLIEKELIQ